MSARRPLLAAAFALSTQGCAIIDALSSGDPLKVASATLSTKEKMDAAVDNIPEKDERALGQGSAFQVIGAYKGLVLEESLVQYVNDVGNSVAVNGERKVRRKDGTPRIASRRVFVGVLDEDSYDAFALPGGYILITRGLLEDLGSESELAWILGHEIAHIDYEDGLKVMKKQTQTGVALTDGMFNLQDSKVFGKLVNYIAEGVLKTGWDKDAEIKADELGLVYATSAGYDPGGASRVLDVLATRPVNTRTHATPAERAKALAASPSMARVKSGGGRLGVARYDERCVRPLEAFAIAKASSGGGAQGGTP